MSTIGVPSMQISREEMKSDPLKFVLQMFPIRFAYHYHRSDGSLAYFDQMEWFQVFIKKIGKYCTIQSKANYLTYIQKLQD
jgi:hypothetical protein